MPAALASDTLGTLNATAQELIYDGVTRSHDLSGVVFQRLIADRKFLATFYTTPSAAALLAALALPERNGETAYDSFKVADFSCGTGTLLSAAYRRLVTLHQAQGGSAKEFHRNAMEDAIVGADIMPMSVQPHRLDARLRLPHRAVHQDEALHAPLRQAGRGPLRPPVRWTSSRKTPASGRSSARARPCGTTGTGEEEVTQLLDVDPGEFDLVIMNPPFTRPTNHAGLRSNIPNPAFAGLGKDKEEQDWMAALAKSLGKATCASGNAGLASYFIALADKMVADSGTIAMVLPLAVLQGQSWQKAREPLAQRLREHRCGLHRRRKRTREIILRRY